MGVVYLVLMFFTGGAAVYCYPDPTTTGLNVVFFIINTVMFLKS